MHRCLVIQHRCGSPAHNGAGRRLVENSWRVVWSILTTRWWVTDKEEQGAEEGHYPYNQISADLLLVSLLLFHQFNPPKPSSSSRKMSDRRRAGALDNQIATQGSPSYKPLIHHTSHWFMHRLHYRSSSTANVHPPSNSAKIGSSTIIVSPIYLLA